MILADTSIWIDFLRNPRGDDGDIFKKYLAKGHIYSVSAIFGELFVGAKSNRERQVLTEFWSAVPKVEEKDLFIEAGQMSNKYKFYAKGVGLIDCFILSAALNNELALWTHDKKLLEAFDEING